jgi:hypothetical protein
MELSYIPREWKVTKIIQLHTSDRGYTLPNSYQPISLLSTLRKILEAVAATQVLELVKTFKLLPNDHFGARKR